MQFTWDFGTKNALNWNSFPSATFKYSEILLPVDGKFNNDAQKKEFEFVKQVC